MRYPEDKIKEAILHPDRDVRNAAIRYFDSSTSSDHTLMPLAIQATERYGRPQAFSFTNYLGHPYSFATFSRSLVTRHFFESLVTYL